MRFSRNTTKIMDLLKKTENEEQYSRRTSTRSFCTTKILTPDCLALITKPTSSAISFTMSSCHFTPVFEASECQGAQAAAPQAQAQAKA